MNERRAHTGLIEAEGLARVNTRALQRAMVPSVRRRGGCWVRLLRFVRRML